jgi:hypothetical protein
MNKKIIKCRITAYPKDFMDPMPKVMVTLEGETDEKELFQFYPDEIDFNSNEFIGLTEDEARALKGKKDKHYLQN